MVRGKKIFISYGSEGYYTSLSRIGDMAKETGLFDDVMLFTEKDLPQEITSHPLMGYKRGGGYWLWKPYVILHALKQCEEHDIVIYSDAGNEVYSHREWNSWFKELEHRDAILFRCGAVMRNWCRKGLLDYYSQQPYCMRFLPFIYQLQSGLALVKKSAMPLIQSWQETMVSFPKYVMDVAPSEMKNESKCFIESRHDQSVLTCVAYAFRNKLDISIKWQHSEYRDRNGQAVFNARISDMGRRSSMYGYESRLRSLLKRIVITPYRELRTKFFIKINRFL